MNGFITGEQAISKLLKQIGELKKENDELRAQLAKLEEDLGYRVYRLEVLLLSPDGPVSQEGVQE